MNDEKTNLALDEVQVGVVVRGRLGFEEDCSNDGFAFGAHGHDALLMFLGLLASGTDHGVEGKSFRVILAPAAVISPARPSFPSSDRHPT